MVYKGPSWTIAGNIQYLNNLHDLYDQKAQYHLSRANYHESFPIWRGSPQFSNEHKRRFEFHMNKYFYYDGQAQAILWQIQAIEGGF